MKRVRLGEETFFVGSLIEMQNCGLETRYYLIINPSTGLAITPCPNKEQIFTLLGHDVRHIDTALPADWAEEQLRRNPEFSTIHWGWSYEGQGNSLGEPVQWTYIELEGALLRMVLANEAQETL
jgi:hypothetical protein